MLAQCCGVFCVSCPCVVCHPSDFLRAGCSAKAGQFDDVRALTEAACVALLDARQA